MFRKYAIKGGSSDLNQTNNKNYIKLYPTFYSVYEMNELNNFGFYGSASNTSFLMYRKLLEGN